MPTDHGVEGEVAVHVGLRGLAERGGSPGVVEQTHHGGHDAGYVAGQDEHAGLAVVDDVDGAFDAGRDDGEPGGHGLEHGVGHAFPEGREHEDVGGGEHGGDVAAEAEEADVVADAELTGERVEVVFERAGADDGMVHTVRAQDEIVIRIIVPPVQGRMVYIKETARKGNDFAYATIAVWANGQGERCTQLRLVLGSLTMRPVVLQNAAELITANGLTDTSIALAVDAVRDELGPLTNLYTPAAYKGRIARSLVKQALQQLRIQ